MTSSGAVVYVCVCVFGWVGLWGFDGEVKEERKGTQEINGLIIDDHFCEEILGH